jgi:hypothetical protein
MPSDRLAAAVGAMALVGAVVGYYASVPWLVEGAAANSRSVVIWGGAALVGGPVFGVAGRWLESPVFGRCATSLALLGGVFLAEGLVRVLYLDDDAALGCVMVAAGLMLPIVIGRSWRERGFALLAQPVVVALTLGAGALIDRLFLGR